MTNESGVMENELGALDKLGTNGGGGEAMRGPTAAHSFALAFSPFLRGQVPIVRTAKRPADWAAPGPSIPPCELRIQDGPIIA